MAGGLMNLVAVGNANIFLTGEPTKTFFKVTYSKYTNFGLQKFRVDFKGTRDLRLTEPSTFLFKMPRYADLLMDTYLVMTLPDIWSPVYPPINEIMQDGNVVNRGINTNNKWVPYEFRWIEDVGARMIQEIEIRCGSFVLARYTGDFLSAMVDRDFSESKKAAFNTMTGNIKELNNPALAYMRENNYPNVFYNEQNPPINGLEPSIRGQNLYVPLNAWFTLDSRCAFPLVALQYNELEISVTLRPIQELFQVRDPFDWEDDHFYPYVKPDFNQDRFQMYRFLQGPKKQHIVVAMDESGNYPSETNNYPVNYGSSNKDAYDFQINTWNADVHLLSTYAFLSKEERQRFAEEDQTYLVKEVHRYVYDNIHGTKKVKLENSTGMVSDWMWYFQRNDVNMRNEWSNYSNWPYKTLPSDIRPPPRALLLNPKDKNGVAYNTGIYISGDYSVENHKHIMTTMGIILDGKYRENTLPRGVFDYIEKYSRTNGFAQEGLYCYQFCLDTNPRTYQPCGAINLGKFKTIELEFQTHVPEIDRLSSNYEIQCNADGEVVAVGKSNWRLFEYTYNLVIFEERYNMLTFNAGNCGMLYAR